jgi:hypothetical protein
MLLALKTEMEPQVKENRQLLEDRYRKRFSSETFRRKCNPTNTLTLAQ